MAKEYRANSLVFNRRPTDKCSMIPNPGPLSCYYIYAISVMFIPLTINLQINNIAIRFFFP
jgi:hypothetical protein